MNARAGWFIFGFVAVAIAFVGGFDLVHLLARGQDDYDPTRFVMTHFFVQVLQWSVLPMVGAAAGVFLLDAARPMRVFREGSRETLSLLARGAGAGTVWAGAMMPLIPAVNNAVSDALLIACTAPLATAFVLMLTCRRDRPGRCAGCGYDLRGSRKSGKCPECGIACGPHPAMIAGA